MSVYSIQPLTLGAVRTYPLASRKSKVSVCDFAKPPAANGSLVKLLDSLPDILAARDVYERALDCYFAGEFERAAELFAEAAGLRPGDLGAAMMRDRAFALANNPPLSWDGVHVMEEK